MCGQLIARCKPVNPRVSICAVRAPFDDGRIFTMANVLYGHFSSFIAGVSL